MSTVRLVAITGTVLEIEDLDILDGTPLLDMKPDVPALDDGSDTRTGWFADRVQRVHQVRADQRFAPVPPRPYDEEREQP